MGIVPPRNPACTSSLRLLLRDRRGTHDPNALSRSAGGAQAVANVLSLSNESARDWRQAKAWLLREMSGKADSGIADDGSPDG